MNRGNWPTARIGEIADVNPRRSNRLRGLDPATEVTSVPMAAVDEISGTNANPETRLFSQVRMGFTPFVEGDVIFAKITPCMQNGKSAIARELANGFGFGSTEFHVLRPGPEVLSEWLWYIVRQRSLRDEAQRYFRGSAGQQRVPDDFLIQHEIPKPPLELQRSVLGRIKECLARVDQIRDLRRAAIPEWKGLLLSLIGSLRDPSWPTVAIGDVASDIRNGWSENKPPHGRPARVLRLSCVHSLIIDKEEAKHVSVSPEMIEAFGVHEGDLFLVRGNGSKHLVGRSAIAAADEPDVIFNDLLIRVRFADRILPAFANLMLHTPSVREQIERMARTAAGIWKINQRMVAGLSIPCPPRAKQEESVRRFEYLRKVTDEVQAILVDADPEVLTQAVLQKAFSGKL